MFVQKSIAAAIILIFTFFCESHGLECFTGVLIKDLSTNEETGNVIMADCSMDEGVCTRTELKRDDSKINYFGCLLHDTKRDSLKPYLNTNQCLVVQHPIYESLVKTWICDNSDGCNEAPIFN